VANVFWTTESTEGHRGFYLPSTIFISSSVSMYCS